MIKEKRLKIGLEIKFSINVCDQQPLIYLYQKEPISQIYEINRTHEFVLNRVDKINVADVNNYVQEQCIDYIYNRSDLGKYLSNIEYEVDVETINFSKLH